MGVSFRFLTGLFVVLAGFALAGCDMNIDDPSGPQKYKVTTYAIDQSHWASCTAKIQNISGTAITKAVFNDFEQWIKSNTSADVGVISDVTKEEIIDELLQSTQLTRATMNQVFQQVDSIGRSLLALTLIDTESGTQVGYYMIFIDKM
jgi:hypothetical protein